MDGSLITSEITRYGRSGKLKLKTPRRIQFLWKTFSFPFTFHPAKRKHPTRFWPQREALSSNSATSKRSRDDFLEKRGKRKKKRRRNDLDVNRANSTSPSRIFELRNAFLERGIPDILRLLPWWWIIWARRLATSVTFAFPLSSRTLERGDSRRRRRGGPLWRFRCQDRGLFKVQPLYIPVPQRNGRRYGRAPWP